MATSSSTETFTFDVNSVENAVKVLLTSFDDVKSVYPDSPALRALVPAFAEFTRALKWSSVSSSTPRALVSSSSLLSSSSSSSVVDDSIDEDETPNDEDMKKLYRLSVRVNESAKSKSGGDVKRGWLLKRKRKDTVAMQQLSQWRRRFFVLNANFLYYFAKENDDSPLGFVDVTTTRVRASETPGKNKLFCFDMLSVASTWQIQSPDSEADTRAWQAVIEAAAQRSLMATLRDGSSTKAAAAAAGAAAAGATTATAAQRASAQRWRTELPALLALPQNGACADCAAAKPTWASINLGVFICLECAGVHRSLGTHISKVRSADLDEWDGIDLAVMDNAKANLFYEATLTIATPKPNARSPVADRDRFIRAKYVARDFLPNNTGNASERSGSAPPALAADAGAAAATTTTTVLSPRAAAASTAGSTLSRNRRAAVLDGVVVHNGEDGGDSSDLDHHRQLLVGVIETVQSALTRLKLAIATDERVEATLMGRGRAVREMQQHASLLYTTWAVARGPTPPLADDMDRLHRLQVMLAYSIGDLETLFDAGLAYVQRASSQAKLLTVLQSVHSIKRTLQKLADESQPSA
jgi:hypothetical protein